MRKDFHGHPSITPQLEGFGAPKPTPTSAEDPLIQGRMKTFPDQHPSLASVRNAQGLGCPALVHSQMTSDQWKSSYQAQICERQPTFKQGRTGKKMVPALAAAGELLIPPRETMVIPEGAPSTYARDIAVMKHMGTLTRAGRW